MQRFYARRNARLLAEVQMVAGALDAVAAAHHHTAGRIACASGADRPKVVMQIAHVGMAPYFGERIFSGHDQPRSKPAPDVYLAAAAHLSADPARCLVVEDTATGAQAGLAAGATVWGYCAHGDGRAFGDLPVHRVFHHMDALRELLLAPLGR
jgi:beta-phosphoglucomutase-like phosphatase (HAD superfamily)